MSYTGIHFNISERKVLLRIFDLVFTFLSLYLVSYYFDFDYFTITQQNWTWVFVLILYLSIFATVFELYDLQKSSKIERVIPNIVLTVSVTVLFYFLTPIFTPFYRLTAYRFYISISQFLLPFFFGDGLILLLLRLQDFLKMY